ncbi:Adenylate kinase, partial [Giardia duodenalis]
VWLFLSLGAVVAYHVKRGWQKTKMAAKITDDAIVKYLEEQQIYIKLQKAMEALAIHKPDNPCGFLKDYFDPTKESCKATHRVIVLGPPCSGKSTMCRCLSEKLSARLICAERSNQTLGSTEVIESVRTQLQQCSNDSWVLDDFPSSELEAFSLRISPDCLPTVVIDLQLPLETVLSRAKTGAERDQLKKRYDVYKINRPAYFKVFEYCIRVIDCKDLSLQDIEARVMAIITGAGTLKTSSNEVLPRGPAIIDEKAEKIAYTMSRAPNTRPAIESVN